MSNKQDLLIILSPGFPGNEADSTCIPPQQVFVKALKESNPQLKVMVLAFQYPFFSGRYQWYEVDVIAFGGQNQGRIYRKFTGLRVWLNLIMLNRQFNIVGLLSFWLGKCALIGDRFAKRYALVHYCWILGQDAKAGNKYVNKSKPDGGSLIALSDFVRKEFNRSYGITPQHLIPVGIEPKMFQDFAGEKDIDVLGAGSLIPLKQYHIFIEAIAALKAEYLQIKAAICGDGPEMAALKKMIAEKGLQDNVKLLGRQQHTEVLRLMQRTKVFLHTSSYEGFGAVCLEALYAGAQVISFVKPMQASVLNWNIAKDKEAMVQMLKNILKNKNMVHQSVLPYPISNNVHAMLKLFNYKPAAISAMRLAIASKESVDLK